MKKIVLLAGAGVLALSACGGTDSATSTPARAAATPSPATSPSKDTAAAPVAKSATPAPAVTVFVTPTPEPPKTIVVVPAPAPATTVYVAPAPNSGVGGIDGPNLYPINSQGSVINVRTASSTQSTIVGTVVQDQYVHIVCTSYGEAVSGPWGTTGLWDRIDSPYYGYISDEWLNTATGAPVVGSC